MEIAEILEKATDSAISITSRYTSYYSRLTYTLSLYYTYSVISPFQLVTLKLYFDRMVVLLQLLCSNRTSSAVRKHKNSIKKGLCNICYYTLSPLPKRQKIRAGKWSSHTLIYTPIHIARIHQPSVLTIRIPGRGRGSYIITSISSIYPHMYISYLLSF